MLDTNRRGFFRILGSTVALLSGRAAAASAAEAPEIHRATRNTRLGALGRRSPKGPAGPAYKTYPGKPTFALPNPKGRGLSLAEVLRGYSPATGLSAQPLSISELGTLLHHTNGVTDQERRGKAVRRRAAPSAGALYSGEVYVVAERVRGLEPGLYYYTVGQHRLVRLRKGSLLEEVAGALERPLAAQGAAAAVLLSNVFGRYSRRYANRGYRYTLIDSGHIGENLRLTGGALGLADVSPLRFWDDSLNDLLGLDGRTEAVCALHLLGREATAKPAEPGPERVLEEKQQDKSPKTRVRGGSVTERFHDATKLAPGSPPATTPAKPRASSGSTVVEGAATIELPSPASSRMRVTTSIRRRRSAGAFYTMPVALRDLSFVLQAAQGNPALERTPTVELDVVVHAVVGVKPGVYRYDPASHRLLALRKGGLRKEMAKACLGQENAGTAAIGLVMAARLDSAKSTLGNRRYRDLLIESGAIGQRIYLSAEAVGLAARNLAAYRDDEFNELLGLERRGLASLHLTMLGSESLS